MRSEKEIRQLISDLKFMIEAFPEDPEGHSHLVATIAGLKYVLNEENDGPSKMLLTLRRHVMAAKGVEN